MTLTLAELIAGMSGLEVAGDRDLSVSSVTADSRQVDARALFVAVQGASSDGHVFVADAVAAGCPAVAVQKGAWPAEVPPLQPGPAGPAAVITAPETRSLPARLARRLQGKPDESLVTAAVTGTNGKTTVAFLLREMLEQMLGPCGLLGTIRYDDGARRIPAPLTTPGGPELYAWLGAMRDNGCRSVAMEISSHALDQERVADLELDVAVMTNIGRDHLDYHGDTDTYVAAKARIADLLRVDNDGRAGTLVLNIRDPKLAPLAGLGCPVITFSTDAATAADLVVRQAQLSLTGTELELDWRGRTLVVSSPLVGRFNVENLTAALAAGLALGLDAETCASALGGTQQVPGRVERFLLPSGGLAVVDYAHTHDALDAVLAACRELTAHRVLVVFGCGGDRDQGKRPLMGEVAARSSDQAWITSDNPRSEDPAAICEAVAAGFDAVAEPRAAGRRIIIDRTEAIRAGLRETGGGDILVVAGKGHEDYQLIGDRRLDLDDRQVIGDWLAEVSS